MSLAPAGPEGLSGLGEEFLVVAGAVGEIPDGGAGAGAEAGERVDSGEPSGVCGRQAGQGDCGAPGAVLLDDCETPYPGPFRSEAA